MHTNETYFNAIISNALYIWPTDVKILFNKAFEKVIRNMAKYQKMNIVQLDVLLVYDEYCMMMAENIVKMGNSKDDVI